MKLLLTSAGITNESIAEALVDLVGKHKKEKKIDFIPTAANIEKGNKDWYIEQFTNLQKHGFDWIDVVDISALPEEIWLPRLEKVDALFFSGGNSFHLMHWIEKSGFRDKLEKFLEKGVYVGSSAGSMVANPTLYFSNKDKSIYYEELFGYTNKEALGFVDFYTRPHFNSSDFPHAHDAYIQKLAKDADMPVYALDDDSAVKIVDGRVEVISEGNWKKYE